MAFGLRKILSGVKKVFRASHGASMPCEKQPTQAE